MSVLRSRYALIFILVLLFSLAVTAQNIEILQARHRPAEELVNVLQPMLGAGESISAYQYQIIVRASPSTLNNLKRILEQIDQPARQYIVQWQIAGQGESNQNRVVGPVILNSDGRNVGGSVGGTVLSTQNNRRDNFSQQVRVMEGSSAWIALTQQTPLLVRQTTVTPYGVVSSSGSQYVSFTSGIAVTPRAIGRGGQQVQLELSPQRSSNPSGAGNQYGSQYGQALPAQQITQATTSITANLGEWVEIGSMGENAVSNERGILSSSEAWRQTPQRLLVRVDEAP